MSKELITKEHADQLHEIEARFQNLRELAKQVEHPVVRKLIQGCLIPIALLIDYVKLTGRFK